MSKPSEQLCIKLGSGCVLVEEDWFVQAFQGLMTNQQFRNWMRNLGVRPIQVGSRWFYEHAQVELAITHATLGTDENEDGVYLGFSQAVVSGYRKTTKIFREEALRLRRAVREELISRKKVNTGVQIEETRRKIRTAAERMPKPSRKQTL